MNQLISEIINSQLFIQTFSYLFVFLITTGIGYLVAYIRKLLGIARMKKIQAELEVNKDLVDQAVKMVEQTYTNLHGQDKYNEAAKWLATVATQKGIKISDEEIKGLIQSTLRTLKDKFGEDWGKAVSETPATTPETPVAK